MIVNSVAAIRQRHMDQFRPLAFGLSIGMMLAIISFRRYLIRFSFQFSDVIFVFSFVLIVCLKSL